MLPPFGWQAVASQWQSAPVVSASAAAAAGLYIWGVARVSRRHPAGPWPVSRTAAFLGGLVVVVVALQSGIGTYDDLLFSDHMFQHLMLIMVAPPLLIFGQPITLLLHASRNPLHTWVKRAVRSPIVSFLTWPPFGFCAYAAVIAWTGPDRRTRLTQVCSGLRLACSSSVMGWPVTSSGGAIISSARCWIMWSQKRVSS